MAEQEKRNRIKELEQLIIKYQKAYYDGEGIISDAEFDKLWDELKATLVTLSVKSDNM